MASSRWRRFAFFDRSTISLPDDVYHDLVPTSSSSTNNKNSNKQDNNGIIPSSSILFDDEISDNPLPPISEYFSISSMAVTLTPKQNPPINTKNNVIVNTLASYGVKSNLSPTLDVNGQTSFQNTIQSNHPYKHTNYNDGNTTWNVSLGSEIVLLFFASRHSPRLHVIDLTMRCSPQLSFNDDIEFENDLPDYDGWKGFILPFQQFGFIDHSTNSNPKEQHIIQQHLSANTASKGRIVGMATSTTTTTTMSPNPNSTPSIQTHAHVAVITDSPDSVGVCVHINPHLYLYTNFDSSTTTTTSSCTFQPLQNFDFKYRGKPRCVDIDLASTTQSQSTKSKDVTTSHKVAVGTDRGYVILYSYTYTPPPPILSKQNPSLLKTKPQRLNFLQEIPPPISATANTPTNINNDIIYSVTSLKLSGNKMYVCYKRSIHNPPSSQDIDINDSSNRISTAVEEERMRSTGVCCYNLGKGLRSVESRFDLDGRDVRSGSICDIDSNTGNLVVARSDGLYAYSSKDRNGVAPIDGTKISMSCLPSNISNHNDPSKLSEEQTSDQQHDSLSTETPTSLSNYVLISAKDSKSGRDVVDIYDANNKLVAFHVLLSPGHKALKSTALITSRHRTSLSLSSNERGGRSSTIVVTSGGAIVTLTEKSTASKVSLLTQKNLYSAAITLAYQDPSYSPSDITALYRRHAEHLYRKGDFESAIDQYIYTIGSLEPSHIIFQFLDAPKIPLLAKYLEVLREKDLATGIHLDLLRTCYRKLNDVTKADKIGVERTNKGNFDSGFASEVGNMIHNPTKALAMICSFEAEQAADALIVHGATLARSLPRETAGLVLSLCDGTFSPNAIADLAGDNSIQNKAAVLDDKKSSNDTQSLPVVAKKFPVELFSHAFLEYPKLLRLILTHCNKQKCEISPSLRRILLELTLEEWNSARRHGDVEKERVRCNQALAFLTDSNHEKIGKYEALVIVQLAGFTEGEVLLYERLPMAAPMLLERFAKDGGERARRQMLKMCDTDPELLADVLGYFVSMASEKTGEDKRMDDESQYSEERAILDTIEEALEKARAQAVLPPVQIARILAGEGVGQFSTNEHSEENARSIPLSVALNYVGSILDDESDKIEKLKAEVEEYNKLCNSMEAEIKSLLSSQSRFSEEFTDKKASASNINVQELYHKLKDSLENNEEKSTSISKEEFWREMDQSDDRFDTITRFFSRGLIP